MFARSPRFFGLSFSVACLAAAASPGISSGQEADKSILTEHHIIEPVRVFYATEGESAIDPDKDINADGVPDRVEDAAKQVWAAYTLFCRVLDFPDPLQSERYPGVTTIQVSLLDRSRINGSNGLSYRMSQRAKPIADGAANERTLVLAVGAHVDPRKNLTPAHELFHLIQYGATWFSNAWYLEGMARWSEHALGMEGLGKIEYPAAGPWPQVKARRKEVYALSYDAEYVLWNPIARHTDPAGVLPEDRLPRELAELRYSDGTPVLRDLSLHGAPLMRDILIELSRIDDRVKEDFGYEDWSLERQKAPRNDPYIYEAVMTALRRHSPEIAPFRAKADAGE